MESGVFQPSSIDWYFLIGTCIALILTYQHFSDPLRSIPGPLLARLTKAWVVLLEISGNRSTTIHNLHKKYGPVVRIAPNQVCFASPQAIRDIYAANSRYLKADIYDSLGFKSVFTTRNRDEYRAMKKRIIPSFNPTAVTEMEPLIHQQVGNLLKCFEKRLDEPLDVLPWFRMLALGVVGEGFAKESFGGLENEKTPDLLHEIDTVFPALWLWWMFPMLSKILQYSPFRYVRKFLRSSDEFRKNIVAVYDNYLASYDPSSHHDLIARMVNERSVLLAKGQNIPRHVTEDGIIDELTNLIFAGTDTTGNTLTYLFWELARNPDWQLQLRNELNMATGNQDHPQYDAVIELPVLEAVVQETLRLRPAAPASLQRLTPEDGGLIDGVALPPNIIVSCQGLTAQRDPTIFVKPDRFNPQRWIDAAKSGNLELMRDQIMVFGKGARACLGKKLATMEIKCAVAAIVKKYNVEIGSSTTDQDMEMTCHTVLIPKGGKCILRLSHAHCES